MCINDYYFHSFLQLLSNPYMKTNKVSKVMYRYTL